MSTIFHELLYRPLFNALMFLYEHVTFQDVGLAIVALTLIIRFILYPVFFKSFKHQMVLQRLQPKIREIQKDHKHDREQQAKALMLLYKEHRINPFSSFLLLLVQLPILIALYRVFLGGFSPEALTDLYSFVSVTAPIRETSIGLINVTQSSIVIVGLAAVAQYFQGKLSIARTARKQQPSEQSPVERMSRHMVLIGPVITVVILYTLPAAIGIYWLITSLFSIVQQIIITRTLDHDEPRTTTGATPGPRAEHS